LKNFSNHAEKSSKVYCSKLSNLARHPINISTVLIAVSGATGFLGAHVVCTLIKQGLTVRAFRRSSSDLKEFEFIFKHYFGRNSDFRSEKLLHWAEADVLDVPSLEEALTGISSIFHCAAVVSFSSKDAANMHQVNIQGTANLVNCAIDKGIKTFCHTSSIAALGRKRSGDTMDENSQWEDSKLNSQYAISKYRAEMEVWRGKEEGLQVVVVNPGVILGVGDFRKGSLSLIEAGSKGMPFYTLGVNGYIDVEDLAQCMVRLTREGHFGKRYVLVSESIENRELFNELAKLFGNKPPHIHVTPLLGEIAWRLYALKRLFSNKGLPLTKETSRSAQTKSYYSNSRIKSTLGLEFKAVKQTLKECAEAFSDFQKHFLS